MVGYPPLQKMWNFGVFFDRFWWFSKGFGGFFKGLGGFFIGLFGVFKGFGGFSKVPTFTVKT